MGTDYASMRRSCSSGTQYLMQPPLFFQIGQVGLILPWFCITRQFARVWRLIRNILAYSSSVTQMPLAMIGCRWAAARSSWRAVYLRAVFLGGGLLALLLMAGAFVLGVAARVAALCGDLRGTVMYPDCADYH